LLISHVFVKLSVLHDPFQHCLALRYADSVGFAVLYWTVLKRNIARKKDRVSTLGKNQRIANFLQRLMLPALVDSPEHL